MKCFSRLKIAYDFKKESLAADEHIRTFILDVNKKFKQVTNIELSEDEIDDTMSTYIDFIEPAIVKSESHVNSLMNEETLVEILGEDIPNDCDTLETLQDGDEIEDRLNEEVFVNEFETGEEEVVEEEDEILEGYTVEQIESEDIESQDAVTIGVLDEDLFEEEHLDDPVRFLRDSTKIL